MSEKESWDSCKHHLGNLERDLGANTDPEVQLLNELFPETEINAALREEGVNQWYYCSRPELRASNAYLGDGMPNKNGEHTPVALLFRLGLIDDPSRDWLGEDRFYLDNAIEQGLAMCTHCKYHENG